MVLFNSNQAKAQAATSQQMAVTAHRLNLLAALFLPLTALASVFGMEIHSHLKDTPGNFWQICGLGILIGLLLGGCLSQRSRLR